MIATPCAGDLLQRARRAPLSRADRCRLDAHVAVCASCRLDRALFADFDGEGSIRPRDDLLDAKLADTLVARLPAARRARKRRTAVWLLAAAAFLSAGVATAGLRRELGRLWVGRISFGHGGSPRAMGGPAAPGATAPVASVSEGSGSADDEAPPAVPVADPTFVAWSEGERPAARPISASEAAPHDGAGRGSPGVTPRGPSVAGALAGPLLRMNASRPARARLGAKLASAETDGAAPAADDALPAATAAGEAETAASLFDGANRERRQGRAEAALALYDRLLGRFPQSRLARIARVSAGRLRLDRGDGAGALAAFQGYLDSGDPTLAPEAMYGAALALERLGRGGEARAAWAELLVRFADSVYAPEARRRLGQGR